MSDPSLEKRPDPPSSGDLVPVVPGHQRPAADTSPGDNAHEARVTSPLNLALVWQSFCRWWYVTLPVGTALAAGSVAFVWFTFEPIYRAEVLLKIEATSPYIFTSVGAATAAGGRFERTQVELIRSKAVLERVVEQPQIASLPEVRAMESPARELAEKLKIESKNASELFNVSYESANAEHAARIVNTVVTQYIQLQDDETVERTRRIVELLDQEVGSRLKVIKQLRSKVQDLEEEMTGVDSVLVPNEDQGSSFSRESMAALVTQLANSIAEREQLEASVTAFQEAMAKEVVVSEAEVEEMVAEAVEASAELQALRQGITDTKWKLNRTIAVAVLGKDDPAAVQYQEQIDDLQQQVENLRSELTSEVTPVLQSRLARRRNSSMAAEVARMETQIRIHTALEKRLTERVNELRKPKQDQQSPGSPETEENTAAELEYARNDLDRAEQVYQALLKRADMLRMESRAPPRVTVLSPATPPKAPLEKVPLKSMAAATLGGFAIPLLLAVFWEFRVQRVMVGKQISEGAVLPLLAEVSTIPAHSWFVSGKSSARLESQRAMFEDSVHYLCRSIALCEQADDLQVLAVTSGVSGEGKTSLASQLALSFSLYCHEPVLLIDADMRNPGIHELFDLPISPGLTELLDAGENGNGLLDSVIVRDRLDLVEILPAGKLGKHPHVLLRPGRFEMLLDTLRRSYRYIIIDTPPVMSAGEALSLCRAADGTLISVRRDWSRQAQVQLAYDRVLATGGNPIGVVLNGVPRRRYTSTYGYYGRTQHVNTNGDESGTGAEEVAHS